MIFWPTFVRLEWSLSVKDKSKQNMATAISRVRKAYRSEIHTGISMTNLSSIIFFYHKWWRRWLVFCLTPSTDAPRISRVSFCFVVWDLYEYVSNKMALPPSRAPLCSPLGQSNLENTLDRRADTQRVRKAHDSSAWRSVSSMKKKYEENANKNHCLGLRTVTDSYFTQRYTEK